MIRRAFVRILGLVLVLALVFVASRALIRALPGDPLDTLLAETGTSIPAETLRAELGLDRPFLAALGEDLARATRGDLGVSIVGREAIGPLLKQRLAATLRLTGLALAIGLAISLALGLLAASDRRGPLARAADLACTAHGSLAAALPVTWVGPMLMYALAVKVPLFPLGGAIGLPALSMALLFSGLWARLIRARGGETVRFRAAG
jgi:peptide/nickel transport system permease protein